MVEKSVSLGQGAGIGGILAAGIVVVSADYAALGTLCTIQFSGLRDDLGNRPHPLLSQFTT